MLEYDSYPLLEFRNKKLLNTIMPQYIEHVIISSIASIPVTCRKVISGPLIRICFTSYVQFALHLFTNTILYSLDCGLKGCQKYVYEKLANPVLSIVLVKTAVQE